MKKHEVYELTYAKHDRAHCLAPGLFRSLKRGDRKRLKLDVVYDYGDGRRIEFSGPEPLGADDLRILQGLAAMAGPNGLVLRSEPRTEAGRQLRLLLEPKWDAIQQDAMVVKGSYRALAREIGYANPDDTKPIRESIERLWKVSIIVQDGRRRMGFRLLSEYASDEEDGKLFVALNPLIARAIIGGQHVHIDMDEVRALRTDPARLMHQRLCGWIDPGKTGRVELDTLCSYVWPDQAGPEAMKKRRQTARKALTELAALGWTVSEYAKNRFEIGRPTHAFARPTAAQHPKHRTCPPHANSPQPPR
ncbi:MAG: replication protein C [Halothiobacillaceae bacterium]